MKNFINIIVKIQPIPVDSLIINIKNSSLIYSFFYYENAVTKM